MSTGDGPEREGDRRAAHLDAHDANAGQHLAPEVEVPAGFGAGDIEDDLDLAKLLEERGCDVARHGLGLPQRATGKPALD